jgi:hypothetical protein
VVGTCGHVVDIQTEEDRGEVLTTRVDSHISMQLQAERNFGFPVGLEVDPINAPEVRAI